MRDLPSPGSFLQMAAMTRLGQADVRNLQPHPAFPHGCSGPGVWTIFCFPRHISRGLPVSKWCYVGRLHLGLPHNTALVRSLLPLSGRLGSNPGSALSSTFLQMDILGGTGATELPGSCHHIGDWA